MKSANPGHLRKARWSISLIFFCYGLIFSSWAARIPTIQAIYDLSEAQLGTLLITLPLGSFISLPIAGYLSARFGSKLVVQLSIIFYAVCLISIAYVPSIYWIGLLLFLLGLSANAVNIAINTQAVDLGKIMNKTIMATFHGLWSLAGFFGAAIGALFISHSVSIEVHYLIIFVITISCALLSFSNLLNNKSKEPDNTPVFVLPDRSLLLLGTIAFCSMLIEGTMFDWSGVYFKKVVGAEQKWLGLGYVAFMISMAGMRFLADTITNKFGAKRLVIFSGVCSFVGLVLVIFLPTLIYATLGFFIVGIGVSAVIPIVFSLAGHTKKMSPSIALAAVSTMGFFGFLLGPPVIGFIAELFDLKISFSFIALMALLIVMLAARIKAS